MARPTKANLLDVYMRAKIDRPSLGHNEKKRKYQRKNKKKTKQNEVKEINEGKRKVCSVQAHTLVRTGYICCLYWKVTWFLVSIVAR